MFNPNSTKSPSYPSYTHVVSIPALFFIPEKDFFLNKKNTFSSETPVLRKDTRVVVHQYAIGDQAKWAKVTLEDGNSGYVVYKDTLAPLPGVPQLRSASANLDYQPNDSAPELNWRLQKPNVVYDDAYNGTYTVHVELENVVDFTGGKKELLEHLEKARIYGTRKILAQLDYKDPEGNIIDILYDSYLISVAEEWYMDPRPCSTLRVAVAMPKRFLLFDEKTASKTLLPPEPELPSVKLPPIGSGPSPFSLPLKLNEYGCHEKTHAPGLSADSVVDLKSCIIDTTTRINDLASIKTPAEINKWIALNQQYERNRIKIESDLFTRSLINLDEIQNEGMRVLLGRNPMAGKTDKQKLQYYVSIAKSLDWAKFLGLAAQCLSRPLPLNEVMALMDKYKEARKFIDQILASTLCNPYLKTGLKIINGFELPVIRAYNPNEMLARELESAFVKIMHDLISFGIKKSLEAAAKACSTDPSANFNFNPSSINPMNLENADQDPAVSDLLDDVYASVGRNNLSDQEKENIKDQFKNMIDDISSCTTYKEMCALYKGNTVNDEVYQVVTSIVKRKYPQFSSLFATREQVLYFFKSIGDKLDLSVCDDDTQTEMPVFSNNGTNILCDDGTLRDIREKILSDRGLTPELIDELLNSKKQEETKALEDVLKLLNSDNPFDFSQVPDLGCKVFPSGETIAPSMQSFTAMLNSMVRSIYDSFDAEAAEWYKTTYSSTDPNRPKILKFNETTGDVEVEKNISISPDKTNSIKANSGKESPATQEQNSKLPSGIDETKYPAFVFKNSVENKTLVMRNVIDNRVMSMFSAALNGDLQQKMDLDFIQNNLTNGIRAGEASLIQLIKKIWSQILGIHGAEINRMAGELVINSSYNLSTQVVYRSIQPMLGFLYSVDTFLRSNVPDSEDLNNSLKNAYLVFGLDDTQQANGFFAAENGAAIYLTICEQLKEANTRNFVISLGIPEAEINSALADYELVKNYYRSIIKLKINYPDFDIIRMSGVNSMATATGEVIPSFYDGQKYDIQRLEVSKNKKNFIKVTEVSKISAATQQFLSSFYSGSSYATKTKEDIFTDYLKNRINKFGFSEDGNVLNIQQNYNASYEELTQRFYSAVSGAILSKQNKFFTLKDPSSPYATLIQATGSGQPYTQYLKLVVPQTPEQKICGIRPHYLDIDNIKDGVLEEKANNICVEKIADDRTVGNSPVSSADLQDIETSSTQDAMLRGMYRLAIRVFLHDLLLRGIVLFGRYDPQSLRDEPMFISFMAKMAESEMRGMDNAFYNMLTDFLVRIDPSEDNSNIRKSDLFRAVVEEELKYIVLPKLAKRIVDDTNRALIANRPKDNPINLVNIVDDVVNYNLFTVKNRAIFLNLQLQYRTNTTPRLGLSNVEQKIYENSAAATDDQVLREFMASNEYEFLFKYLLPSTQILNDFFITSCLSTTTRKQIVNSFKGTKRDVMTTAKIIQTNGQDIARNPNNTQDAVDDPMQLIAGFLLQMAFKTPINVLKGIAESTEPNIALSSMAFKIARAFVPELPSLLIPAVSIPLGTIPTPITCPLPFINPILAFAYFATLAWYDDKPLEETVNNAIKTLEKSVLKVVCGDNIKNQDKFYQDKVTKIGSSYDVTRDAQVGTATETTQEQLMAAQDSERRALVVQKILAELKLGYRIISQDLAMQYIDAAVLSVESINGIKLLANTNNLNLLPHYNTAVSESGKAIDKYVADQIAAAQAAVDAAATEEDAAPTTRPKPNSGNTDI